MKKLILASIASSLISIIAYKNIIAGTTTTKETPAIEKHIKETSNSSFATEKLQATITALTQENALLQSEIDKINRQCISADPVKSSNTQHSTPTTSSDAYTTQDGAITNIQLAQENENIYRWLDDAIKRDPNFDIGEHMQSRFENESPDTEWAGQQEIALVNLFSSSKDFSGIALKGIQCRTTQCQVQLSTENITQANTLVELASANLLAGNLPATVIAAPDLNTNTLTLYIARNSQGFNFK